MARDRFQAPSLHSMRVTPTTHHGGFPNTTFTQQHDFVIACLGAAPLSHLDTLQCEMYKLSWRCAEVGSNNQQSGKTTKTQPPPELRKDIFNTDCVAHTGASQRNNLRSQPQALLGAQLNLWERCTPCSSHPEGSFRRLKLGMAVALAAISSPPLACFLLPYAQVMREGPPLAADVSLVLVPARYDSQLKQKQESIFAYSKDLFPRIQI